MSVLIAIDPSVNSTGIAVWRWLDGRGTRVPVETHLWKPKARLWTERLGMLARLFNELITSYSVHKITTICELPQVFDSAKGHAAAAKGDTVKLSSAVGAFLGIAALHGQVIVTVPVIRWKGQLPKDVVKRRIIRILGKEFCNDYRADEWDAIGIGLWHMGLFE